MRDDDLELLEGDDPQHVTYLPTHYGNGRFERKECLAKAGQGYALLVRDLWSGGPAVLKGLWWERRNLDEPRRSAGALGTNNAMIQQGVDAARRATQLNQQAPTVVATLHDPSPSLRAVGYPTPLEECFVVQQFIGTQWTPAKTLRKVIQERAHAGKRFTELELLDIAAQLCDTLAAVHAERRQGPSGQRTYWIHSDIKPENILVLGPPWRYTLIDYDGAVEKDNPLSVTTEQYSPPRNRSGDNPEGSKANERFDIYMLGATLAEAAGLRRLSEDIRRDLYDNDEKKHIDGKRAIRQLGCGPILTTVIASCLAAPQHRLGSVAAVAADLARARSACLLSGLLTEAN